MSKATRDYQFGARGPNKLHQITPLGAAIVEALPDRTRIRAIKRAFRKGRCPASAIFDKAAVEAFYHAHGQQITATEP